LEGSHHCQIDVLCWRFSAGTEEQYEHMVGISAEIRKEQRANTRLERYLYTYVLGRYVPLNGLIHIYLYFGGIFCFHLDGRGCAFEAFDEITIFHGFLMFTIVETMQCSQVRLMEAVNSPET
jgi:hypothetical protein